MDARLEKDTRFWNRVARKYAADPIADVAGYENTLKAVSQRLNLNDSVIEIGCGTGSTALRLANAAGKYLATDLSTEMIAIAQEKAAAEDVPNLTFAVGEPVSADWPDAAYDCALAFNVLHLVSSPSQTLAAIHRMLKPGGLFISKTPCLKRMNPMIRLLIPIMKLFGKAPSVSVFAPEDIEAFLLKANFEIVERAWHGEKGKDTRPYVVARKI